MNISTLNEIKNNSVVLYYKLPYLSRYELWVGTKEKADETIQLIRSAFPDNEGLHIYQGSLQTQEKTEDYLILVEKDNNIRMQSGSWEEVFNLSELQEDADMKAIIPLFELKNKQEEADQMKHTQVETLTGAEIITTAKPGVLYCTISEPVVLIKKDVDGTFIYNDTEEVVVINNAFLAERFTLYVEPKQETTREYLLLEEALKAFINDEHLHADIYLPDGTTHENVCLNKFIPIAQAVEEVKDEGPLEFFKFISSFQQSLREGNEDALDLLNPVKAHLPVEILLYGKFFIEESEEESLFSK